jgi:hypothetical protein
VLDRLLLLPFGPDGTDENMRVLQIGSDIDGTHGNKWCLEFDFPADDDTKLALDQFADSEQSK